MHTNKAGDVYTCGTIHVLNETEDGKEIGEAFHCFIRKTVSSRSGKTRGDTVSQPHPCADSSLPSPVEDDDLQQVFRSSLEELQEGKLKNELTNNFSVYFKHLQR